MGKPCDTYVTQQQKMKWRSACKLFYRLQKMINEINYKYNCYQLI